jgi:ATP-binding cassette subfamily B protein
MSSDLMALLRLLRPYARRYAIGGLFLLGCDLGQLAAPRIVGDIVDALHQGRMDMTLLTRYVGLLLTIALCIAFFRFGWRYFVFGTARMVERNLRNRLYAHLQSLSARFFGRRKVGDLMAHATNDVMAVRAVAGEGVMAGLDGPIYIVCVLSVMLALDWRLTLAALAPLPLIAWISARLGHQVHLRYKGVQDAFSLLSDRAQEAISGVRIVKGFVQEEPEKVRFGQAAERYRRDFMAMERFHAGFDPVIGVLSGTSTVVALAYGGYLVRSGAITLGGLVTFLGWLHMLTWPMLALSWAYNLVQRATASLVRLNELFAEQPEGRGGEIPAAPSGEIAFRNLTFGYDDARAPVLDGINLVVKPGQVLGIVGRTGAGKSTMASLLLRFYAPPAGTVFLDGKDIRDLDLGTLRGAIGYVPQDAFLFSRSLADNVDFGPVPRGTEQVAEALEIAAIADEVRALPQTERTILGERGVTLSGGQRQRVSLARALVQDPPVLVLDDCLSAVDAQTEVQILEGLRAFMRGRTTLIIAHRLSIVRHADHIVLLDRGRIVEQGTHDDLVALGGDYSRMWEQQQLELALEVLQ